MDELKKTDEITEPEPKGEMSVVFNPETFRTDYVSFVHAAWDPQIVVLTFVQKFTPQEFIHTSDPSNILPDGRVIGRYAITWPLAEQLRDLMNKALSQASEPTKIYLRALGGKDNDRRSDEG